MARTSGSIRASSGLPSKVQASCGNSTLYALFCIFTRFSPCISFGRSKAAAYEYRDILRRHSPPRHAGSGRGAGAVRLIWSADPNLFEIVVLSLQVSLSAVALATLLGLPIGAAVGVGRFAGRRPVIVVL